MKTMNANVFGFASLFPSNPTLLSVRASDHSFGANLLEALDFAVALDAIDLWWNVLLPATRAFGSEDPTLLKTAEELLPSHPCSVLVVEGDLVGPGPQLFDARYPFFQ